MELNFEVKASIRKPVGEVFDAVYNPEKLRKYFIRGQGGGALDKGARLTLDFADFPGAFPVRVLESRKDEHIVMEWGSPEGDDSDLVEFRFESPEPECALVRIMVSGKKDTRERLARSYMRCQGWMRMARCLKTWLENGGNPGEES